MAEGGRVVNSEARHVGDGGISNIVEVQGFSKNTSQEVLEMYFENSRRSGGGDVEEVQIRDGVAYITFNDVEVAQRVVSRSTHQVDGQTLTVALFHPSPPKPCYENRVLIQGLNNAVTEELLTNFLETVTEAKVTEFQYGDQEGNVVVTLSDNIDISQLRKAFQERRVEGAVLKVTRVAISNCILVRNLQSSTSHDAILFYFENKKRSGGGDVERVEMKTEEGYCLVYFEDHSVIDRVLSQSHMVHGADVEVHIHHECLGRRSSSRRPHLNFKKSNIRNKDTASPDDKTTENSIKVSSDSISSDYDKASDFVEVPEWQINDGTTLQEKKFEVVTKDEQRKETSICTETVDNVSEIEFRVMEILGNEWMKNTKFSWKNNCILISGPVTVEPFIRQVINSMLEVLRGKQFEIFSLDELEKKVARDVMQKVWSRDTICIFDEKNSQIVVYSDKQDDIMKFKHMLKIRSGKVKESGMSRKRFTAFSESQATEAHLEGFSSLVRSCGIGKQFSLSKDASDVEVFCTKENIKVVVYMANILSLPVDCIVNAANDRMQHGDGVAKVIADAAGPELVQEGDAIIRNWGNIHVGFQVITTAGRLPYRCVIHTVGPCWSDYSPHNLQNVKKCEEDLYKAIYGCFLQAEKKELSTIALPAVSSGIYAVPQDMCTVQYARAVIDYSRKSVPRKLLREIHFIDKDPDLVKLMQDTFRTMIQNGKEPNYNIQNYVAHRQQSKDTRGDFHKNRANAANKNQISDSNLRYSWTDWFRSAMK